MTDDDEARTEAVRRAELTAFAESWQLLGLVAVVHLWPPVLRSRRGAPRSAAKTGAGRPRRRAGWWRCACGTRRWQVRRAFRTARNVVVSGLVWFGLSGAGLTAETLAEVRRWCDDMQEVPAPCCPGALDGLTSGDRPG